MATLVRNSTVLDFNGGEPRPTEFELRDPLESRLKSPCYAVIRDTEVFVSTIPCDDRIHVYCLSSGALDRSIALPAVPEFLASTSPNLIVEKGRIYAYRSTDTSLYEIRDDQLFEVARTTHEIMSLQIAEVDSGTLRFLYSNRSGGIFSVRSTQEACSVEHEVRIEGSKSNYLVGYQHGNLILWTSKNELLVIQEDQSQFRLRTFMALTVRSFVVDDMLYIWHANKIGVFNLTTKKFCKVKLDLPFLLLKRTQSPSREAS